MAQFPSTRMRRNRQHKWLRDLVAETHLSTSDLILPLFVIEGENKREPIATMPDIERLSIDLLKEQVYLARDLGIKAIALFPAIDNNLKNETADEAYNPENLLCRTVRELKRDFFDIGLICDIALDPYTSHGHDGILKNNDVANDETLEVLAKQAIVLAQAGCDIVAPSDMMDGRIGFIRKELDNHNLSQVGILAYAAKYASKFYGPFRDAVGSTNNFGKANKFSYQMDFRNSSEALREVSLDIQEGADIILVKPANLYLDVIRQIKDRFSSPIFAYQVSGEYAAIYSASNCGWLDKNEGFYESLVAIKRAGANAIITYSALSMAKWLKETIQ